MGEFCLNILNEVKPLEEINSTLFMLIPMISKLGTLKDFRPISLCSILCKIISKTMANQFRKTLDTCIDKAQSTFVPRRMITGNVLLAYEILHMLKQKRIGKQFFHVDGQYEQSVR